MKVTSTEEAIADIVEAITHLNERNPYYQRHPDELLILGIYHQARRPFTR